MSEASAALRVGIAGIAGRLGRVAADAVVEAKDLELVGGVVSERTPLDEASYVRSLDDLLARAGIDVLLDVATQPGSERWTRDAVAHGIPVVSGSSGWSEATLDEIGGVAEKLRVPALFVPNFAIGAVVMMRVAAEIARTFPRAEIVEMHHDAKRDSPSGTAKVTAKKMEAAGAAPVVIHSVRLPGLVAHQEIIFGSRGEMLTLRHDSLSRESFAAGIIAALRGVRRLPPGLHVGLELVL
ncbi:MAG: 4-hydroxy-tetrahydrodipicolinate reductase [Candidatus Eremiobacteraeota bacterium]|nr:dihydrodipicolinate reductase C-terminal domain-containing protein [Candidatus Eremiobacteraeota bacterium]NNM92319.1 4-hydroxy-tetrahydrodipicolinate reductase [Candidatus Eremiobacteraeota bacterium]